MAKKYLVTLTDEELTQVLALTHKGRIAARRLMRAHILRLAHEQQTDEVIAHTLQTSVATVERIRERFVLGGVDYALAEEPRVGAPRKLDGKQEAFLVALACSTPPEGHRAWTMQLLADQLIKSKVVEPELSDETVRRTLKKTISSRGSVVNGVFRRLVPSLSGAWKMCSTYTRSLIIQPFPWSVLTSGPIN
jgi:transposase